MVVPTLWERDSESTEPKTAGSGASAPGCGASQLFLPVALHSSAVHTRVKGRGLQSS